jgi:hypothetical protein
MRPASNNGFTLNQKEVFKERFCEHSILDLGACARSQCVRERRESTDPIAIRRR